MADDFPEELTRPLAEFHRGVVDVEEALAPLLSMTRERLNERMSVLEKAKLDLASVYATNTLFYVYLTLNGVDLKEHSLKGELSRIKSLMDQAQEIEDREKLAPRLDVGVAKRFIRSGLWELGNEQNEQQDPSSKGAIFASSANSIQIKNTKWKRHASAKKD